jgi:ADP-ribose pyrophosphatase
VSLDPADDDRLRETVVASEVLHRGRYLEFRVDTVERPDGSLRRREVAGHPGAVAIVALDADERVLLVRQFRSATGHALLEIPAGTLERDGDGSTEDPLGAARRELEEETGHRAATWTALSRFYTAPGFTDELMHLFLATGIEAAGDDALAADDDESIEVVRLPLAAAVAAVDRGEIADAKSIVGILWVARTRPAGR